KGTFEEHGDLGNPQNPMPTAGGPGHPPPQYSGLMPGELHDLLGGSYQGGPGSTNLTGPPPGDSGGTTTTNPIADPLQALKDEIQRQNLSSKLQGILVAGLFQDGAVKIGPDGQLHQYSDAVVQNGSDGITFQNATMISGLPNTLNYQTT